VSLLRDLVRCFFLHWIRNDSFFLLVSIFTPFFFLFARRRRSPPFLRGESRGCGNSLSPALFFFSGFRLFPVVAVPVGTSPNALFSLNNVTPFFLHGLSYVTLRFLSPSPKDPKSIPLGDRPFFFNFTRSPKSSPGQEVAVPGALVK